MGPLAALCGRVSNTSSMGKSTNDSCGKCTGSLVCVSSPLSHIKRVILLIKEILLFIGTVHMKSRDVNSDFAGDANERRFNMLGEDKLNIYIGM